MRDLASDGGLNRGKSYSMAVSGYHHHVYLRARGDAMSADAKQVSATRRVMAQNRYGKAAGDRPAASK